MKYLFLISLVLCASCVTQKKFTQEQIQAESQKLNVFFEKTFDEQLQREPQFETYVGGKRNYDKLDDISEVAALKEHEITKAQLAELAKFDFAALDEQGQVSYRIFKYINERRVSNFKFRYHNYPLNQMFGAQSELPSFMMNMHLVEIVDDPMAYIARHHGCKRYHAKTVSAVRIREQKGIVPPQFVYDQVISDVNNLISGEPFVRGKAQNAIWEDFNQKVSKLKASSQVKKTLLKDAKTALLESVKPAFEGVLAYMTELKKKAPVESGASRLPDGKAFYESQLAYHTSTDFTAEEVHQIGLKEIARIHGEMSEIMKRVGFTGTLPEFFKHMQTSEKFRFADTASGKKEYLKKSTEIIETMKSQLGQLFTVRPKADLVVKAVEAYREKSAGLAFYEGPSEDGKRSGIFYVNLYDMKSASSYEMEALAYHEGIPGHHMQVAISTELQGVPRFRKYAWMTAYGEGWGLYSELIPKEIGMYQDPYSDFGRLAMELWRAVRLAVDTGLHAKGWTREQGIKFIVDNTPSGVSESTKAVERYLVMPGQATAYKVGMLKILDLRKKAQGKLGQKFDLRGFHDEILRNGAMPLSMLEEQIDNWIAKKASQTATL